MDLNCVISTCSSNNIICIIYQKSYRSARRACKYPYIGKVPHPKVHFMEYIGYYILQEVKTSVENHFRTITTIQLTVGLIFVLPTLELFVTYLINSYPVLLKLSRIVDVESTNAP